MSDGRPTWTFLSNHAHVMILLDRNCDSRIRDMAVEIGITERAVQRILGELLEVGAIRRERVGRRNHYELNRDLPLRHQLEADHTVGDLLAAMAPVRLSRAGRDMEEPVESSPTVRHSSEPIKEKDAS